MIKMKNPNAFPIGKKFGFFICGGDCWTRTSDLLRVNYNRFEYIDTKINKNNNICCDFATFRRAILQGLALAPVGN